MAFDRTQMKIRSLVERVDAREIRLPEIQRDYVWKSHQIAKLLDSLYRQYPSGSLLLWETGEEVVERQVRSTLTGTTTFRPLYLLDGQQRLTSLHRVFNGHPQAEVVFNVATEKFQLASAATRKDRRWIPVHTILAGKVRSAAKADLLEALDGALDADTLDDRVAAVARIADYEYYVETIRGLSYVEVTDIFVRVNSRGRNLTRSDLALATLTAKYPGFYDRLKARADANAAAGYAKLGVSTLVRALAVFGTPTGTLEGLAASSTGDIDAGWAIVERGVAHLLPLLKNNLDLANDSLLPSANALIPLIGFLGRRDQKALPTEEADALLYWLLIALLTSRYSGAVDTKLAQDRTALTGSEPLRDLNANLGLVNAYKVTPESLIGRSTDSAAFMLAYLATRARGAHDWWTASRIGMGGAGAFRIEYHHIHPQATLKQDYVKAQINDIANLAFISEAANKRISNRSPHLYFPEIGDEELARHVIPLNPDLRTKDRYLDFLDARRATLVEAINGVLDRHAPTFLGTATDTTSHPVVAWQIYADGPVEDGVLRISYTHDEREWSADLPMRTLLGALDDTAEGIATQLDITDTLTIPVHIDDDVLSIQTGPVTLEGTLEDWRRVIDREIADIAPRADAGPARRWDQPAEAWTKVPVLECE